MISIFLNTLYNNLEQSFTLEFISNKILHKDTSAAEGKDQCTNAWYGLRLKNQF